MLPSWLLSGQTGGQWFWWLGHRMPLRHILTTWLGNAQAASWLSVSWNNPTSLMFICFPALNGNVSMEMSSTLCSYHKEHCDKVQERPTLTSIPRRLCILRDSLGLSEYHSHYKGEPTTLSFKKAHRLFQRKSHRLDLGSSASSLIVV